MNIINLGRPQTAPRLTTDDNRLEFPGGLSNIHNSSISSHNSRPKSHREIEGNRRPPRNHRSPVPHSFRYAAVNESNRSASTTSPKLMIGSKSMRQLSRTYSADEKKSQSKIKTASSPLLSSSQYSPPPPFHPTTTSCHPSHSSRSPSPLISLTISTPKMNPLLPNHMQQQGYEQGYEQDPDQLQLQVQLQHDYLDHDGIHNDNNKYDNHHDNSIKSHHDENINNPLKLKVEVSPSRELENQIFHDCRKSMYENASDRDKAALKLGRLILSTILTKPEISVADSISRFFTDVWLSKSGTNSTLETTDLTSIDLLANLHRSMTAHNPGPEASITEVATSQKSIAAVACEALDALIVTFGKSNPILTDIKEALLPVIFMTQPNPAIRLDIDPKGPFTGKSYINLPTWCEDASVLMEEMQATERSFVAMRKEKIAIEQERNHFKQLYDEMVHEQGQAQGKILSTTREQERLRDLYRNLKKSHKSLEEEHSKLVATNESDKEQFLREKKANSQLSIRLEESKDKYASLLAEKIRLDDLRTSQQQEIAYLKSEILKQKDQLAVCQEEYKSMVELNKKYLADYEVAHQYRLDQSRKYQEAMDRIEKSINTPTINFTMGNKVLNLIRGSQRNVIEILECWNVELLERNSVLEAELAATDVNQIVSSALQAQSELHEEQLTAATKANQLALDTLRKTKDAEINQLRIGMDQVRNELFETQIDRNRTEDLLKVVEAEMREVDIKFEATKRELEKRMEYSTTTKVRFQDRADMLQEDNLFEVLLREQQALCEKRNQEIVQLVQELTVLNSKFLDVEETLETTNESLGKKILELNNFKATSMEMTADMAKLKERIEFLSRPNKREQILEESVERLQSELQQDEKEIETLSTQLRLEKTKRLTYQQLLDRLGMTAEDNIANLIKGSNARHDQSKKVITSLEGQVQLSQKRLEEMETIRKMMQINEQQLMGHEDRLTKTANLIARVLKAQRSLFSSTVTSFRAENDEGKDFHEFDFSELDREENELKALLEKEKEAHLKTKEKMKQKLSAELIKQNNLDLERQEVVAQVFRLKEELNSLKEEKRIEGEEHDLVLREMREGLWMSEEELSSWRLHSEQKKKLTEDKFTEISDDLETKIPTNKASTSSSTRRTSVASIRIPHPKSTKGGKGKEGKEVKDGKEVLEEITDELEGEGSDEIGEMSSGATRKRSLNSKKPKSIETATPTNNRRMSELHKLPVGAGVGGASHHSPSHSSATPIDKFPKPKESPQSAKNGRRNTEFFPNKMKNSKPSNDNSKTEHFPSKNATLFHEAKEELSNESKESSSSLSSELLKSSALDLSHLPKESSDDELSPLPENSGVSTSARLLPSYSRSRSKSLQFESSGSFEKDKNLRPSLSRKQSLTENGRLVDLAQEKAEILSKIVNFDSSISTQSSSNYFFDILELREKRNIFENSRLKIILREAAGLVKRIEENLSKFAIQSLHTPTDASGRNYSLVNEIRNDIQEHTWVFNLKPEQVVENEVLKDAILIGGRVKTLAAYDDDLVSLEHCKDVFPDVKCTIGLEKLTRQVEGMKKDIEKTMKRSSSSVTPNTSISAPTTPTATATATATSYSSSFSRSKWKSILYRSDGSVDATMSMTGWSPHEKNEIYAEIVSSLLLEMDDRTQRFHQEIELLREIIRETDRKRSEEEERANKLQDLPQTQEALHKKEDYEALVQCVGDVILLLQHLTGSDTDELSKSLVVDTLPGSNRTLAMDRSLYGNSALIWKKILKRQTEAKLKEFKGQLNRTPQVDHATPSLESSPPAPEKVRDIAGNVKSLVTEAGSLCERLTEKILFPNGINPSYQNPFLHHQQENAHLGIGDDAFNSHSSPPKSLLPPPSSSQLFLSPELIFQSDRLNSEINSHRNAIKTLQEKQKSILSLNLDAMKIEAEKYYAGTLQASRVSENILKWSSVFAEGSGSLFTREILHRSISPPLDDFSPTAGAVTGTGPATSTTTEGKEFPIIERRSLSSFSSTSRPTSAHLPPVHEHEPSFSSFLALPDFRRKGSPPNLFTPVLEHRRNKRLWK